MSGQSDHLKTVLKNPRGEYLNKTNIVLPLDI